VSTASVTLPEQENRTDAGGLVAHLVMKGEFPTALCGCEAT
jgi:hypothetical protein